MIELKSETLIGKIFGEKFFIVKNSLLEEKEERRWEKKKSFL